jgi:hypothetical protein
MSKEGHDEFRSLQIDYPGCSHSAMTASAEVRLNASRVLAFVE